MVYSDPQVFGELTLVFSAAESSGPDGYYGLAGIIDLDVTDRNAIYTWVKETNPGSGILAEPVSWETSRYSWRPTPPAGYRPLSDASHQNGSSTDLADLDWQLFRCVRNDYTAEGRLDGEYGEDVLMPLEIPDGADALIIPGYAYYDNDLPRPPGAYMLNVPVSSVKGDDLRPPVLTDYDDVPEYVNEVSDHTVTLPCGALTDTGKTADWIVQNSPVYTVQRRRAYQLVKALNLREFEQGGEISETVGWGVTTGESETFSKTVGIKVGFEIGAEFEGFGGKMTGEISTELGYERTHSVEEMKEESSEVKVDAAAKHTTALYAEHHSIVAHRADGSEVSDRNGLDFNANGSYVAVQYPRPEITPTSTNTPTAATPA
ncbi:hypothetical protein [Streptomyces microflavus]|uniref:hypothetical protein n=1 Tax=Streptomyces microflavus TaxID=1919 RepID=UPI0036EF8CF9